MHDSIMAHADSEDAEGIKFSEKPADDLSDDSGVPSDDVSVTLNSNQDDSQESCILSENDPCSEAVDNTHSKSVIDDLKNSKLNGHVQQEPAISKELSKHFQNNHEDDSVKKTEICELSENGNVEQSTSSSSANVQKKILKRKLHNDNDDDENDDDDLTNGNPPKKKKKKAVEWDEVTIYYFSRTQGFTSVPSQGGSTLGMANEHNYKENLSLSEHADKLKNLHKKILSRLRNKNKAHLSASEDSEGEKDEEYVEEDSDISDSDLENQFFLQPVSVRKRRAMLRASGVRKIDSLEKEDCRKIRSSREFCGCDCKTICNPETCLCSQAGIKCQVDRMSFPCGCTRDGCGNAAGRIEFNPSRVRTHFLKTLMNLEVQRKKEEQSKWKSNDGNSIPHHIYFSYDNTGNYTVESGTSSSYSCVSSNYCHQINYQTPCLAPQLPYNATNNKDSTHLMLFNPDNSGETQPVRDDSFDIYSSPYSPDGSSYSETSECTNDSLSPPPPHDENCSSTSANPSVASFTNHFQSENQSADYLSSNPSVFDSNRGNEEEEQKYTDLSAATPSTTKYEPLSELFNPGSNYSNRPNNSFEYSQHDSYSIIADKEPNSLFSSSSLKLGEMDKPVATYSSSEDVNITTSTNESSDNFGEIIKKTMVETVSA